MKIRIILINIYPLISKADLVGKREKKEESVKTILALGTQKLWPVDRDIW